MTKKRQPLQDHPYQIGQAYLIRSVTMYYIGKLVAVLPHELVLENAAWIPDTGRFFNAVTQGTLVEVEPFGPGQVIVGRGSVIDASRWMHAIPTEQK